MGVSSVLTACDAAVALPRPFRPARNAVRDESPRAGLADVAVGASVDASVDAALVRRTRDGDREAFGQLVRRHLLAVRSAAFAVLADAADAEDVAQDAFLNALTRIEECRPEEKFRGWLLVIARNRAIDVRRRQRVRAVEPLDAGTDQLSTVGHVGLATRVPSPLESAERADVRQHLRAALATLTDVRREVVLLHDLEGWSHREIAERLGVAEGTVRAHLFWARRALRERLRAVSMESGHGI